MNPQTLADEWDGYLREVLARSGADTPDAVGPLRMIFYAGATAALTLIGPEATPLALLLAELREHAASIREAVQ